MRHDRAQVIYALHGCRDTPLRWATRFAAHFTADEAHGARADDALPANNTIPLPRDGA